jgi:endoglucanase
LLLGLIGAAAALITLNAMSAHDKSATLERKYEYNLQNSRKIQDGLNSTDLVDDDGQVGNPKKYPSMGCELPDYQSKNGQIYAVSKNGTEVPVGIKGVNWFGMETYVLLVLISISLEASH